MLGRSPAAAGGAMRDVARNLMRKARIKSKFRV